MPFQSTEKPRRITLLARIEQPQDHRTHIVSTVIDYAGGPWTAAHEQAVADWCRAWAVELAEHGDESTP